MSWMFYNCSYLILLDLSSFNTEKVNDMSRMFFDCKKLETLKIDREKFVRNRNTKISLMFDFTLNLAKSKFKSFIE